MQERRWPMCYRETVSGGLFEATLLGRCRAPYRGKVEWQVDAELVRRLQPPRKSGIIVALEREFERRGLPARFFTAVGSGLDRHYGTDGWFELWGCVVTIDVTINLNKFDTAADVLIHEGEFEKPSMLAARIAAVFVAKLH